MRQPDFLCIGAQKAGSLWLYRRLMTHPKIWLPFVKEVHFFDSRSYGSTDYYKRRIRAELQKAIGQASKDRRTASYAARLSSLDDGEMLSWEWYLRLFDLAPQDCKAGEITPRYSTLPEEDVRRMSQEMPDTKIIYVIRDPYERALSAFRMFVQSEPELAAHPELLEQKALQWFERGDHTFGDYADFIPRWDKHFEEGSNLLYVPFAAIAQTPNRILRQIENFIGVRPRWLHPGARRKANRTKAFPAPRWIEERLQEEMRPHRDFVRTRFSSDFCKQL